LRFEHRKTDWLEIVGLYTQLARVAPSPIVDLNRAVAIAMVDGPEAALSLIDAIAETGQLNDSYVLRAGHFAESRKSYQTALALAPGNAERRFIESRLQALPAS
jgi:RNA polymerase sigma-70 factor, ECF subfamily